MFFMIGITEGRKEFDWVQTMLCPRCGHYGRVAVYMTYTQLLLFFLPVARWGRRYWAVSSCCGTVWELDRQTGEAVARGKDVKLDLEKMHPAGEQREKQCPSCGTVVPSDYSYCPKCGHKF